MTTFIILILLSLLLCVARCGEPASFFNPTVLFDAPGTLNGLVIDLDRGFVVWIEQDALGFNSTLRGIRRASSGWSELEALPLPFPCILPQLDSRGNGTLYCSHPAPLLMGPGYLRRIGPLLDENGQWDMSEAHDKLWTASGDGRPASLSNTAVEGDNFGVYGLASFFPGCEPERSELFFTAAGSDPNVYNARLSPDLVVRERDPAFVDIVVTVRTANIKMGHVAVQTSGPVNCATPERELVQFVYFATDQQFLVVDMHDETPRQATVVMPLGNAEWLTLDKAVAMIYLASRDRIIKYSQQANKQVDLEQNAVPILGMAAVLERAPQPFLLYADNSAIYMRHVNRTCVGPHGCAPTPAPPTIGKTPKPSVVPTGKPTTASTTGTTTTTPPTTSTSTAHRMIDGTGPFGDAGDIAAAAMGALLLISFIGVIVYCVGRTAANSRRQQYELLMSAADTSSADEGGNDARGDHSFFIDDDSDAGDGGGGSDVGHVPPRKSSRPKTSSPSLEHYDTSDDFFADTPPTTSMSQARSQFDRLVRDGSLGSSPSATDSPRIGRPRLPTDVALQQYIIPKSELLFGDVIGEGAFGVVYAGTWRTSPVAIKVLKTGSLDNAAARARHMTEVKKFKKEAAALARLRPHPNVVTFFGVMLQPQLAIVVRLCEGGALDELLYRDEDADADESDERAELDNTTKLLMIQGIARGLDHLHQEGVIHRDIASRNVLLDASLNPLITDFGMSREMAAGEGGAAGDDMHRTETRVGPIRWMAPEQLKSLRYSRKSDVYAFGCLCYEILMQRRPWEGESLATVGQLVLNGRRLEIPRSCGAPPLLISLIATCWSYEAASRPSMSDLVASIESNLDSMLDFLESSTLNVPGATGGARRSSAGGDAASSGGSSIRKSDARSYRRKGVQKVLSSPRFNADRSKMGVSARRSPHGPSRTSPRNSPHAMPEYTPGPLVTKSTGTVSSDSGSQYGDLPPPSDLLGLTSSDAVARQSKQSRKKDEEHYGSVPPESSNTPEDTDQSSPSPYGSVPARKELVKDDDEEAEDS